MVTNEEKTVAIPVETKVRELDGKLWLALHLVSQGFHVVFGELGSLNAGLDLLQPHIYLGKSAVYREERSQVFNKLKQAGSLIVILDTEGGVFRSEEIYIKNRLSPKIIQYSDAFVAWGEAPKDIIHKATGFAESKILVAGNPRFDLLFNAYRSFYNGEVAELGDLFGDFILVNTNFSAANPYGKESQSAWLVRDPDLLDYQQALFQSFLEAIERLSRDFPNLNIVVRPHPSERHATYREQFQECNNVMVEHWGNVHPWILASKLVLHNSCTTGIEAVMAGRPAVTYRPVRDERYDMYLPNFVSMQCVDYNELKNEVTRLVSGSDDWRLSSEQFQELTRYFRNTDGQAASRISDFVASLETTSSKGFETVFIPPALQQLKRLIATKLGHITLSRITKWRKFQFGTTYLEQKFPGVTEQELLQKIMRLQNLDPELNERIRVERIPELLNCFWIAVD
jgi:surface carbohydrate biosynthesis protein